MKSIKIFVNLMGYGIVEVPVTYTTDLEEAPEKICKAECRLTIKNATDYSRSHSLDFTLIYSSIPLGEGYAVSVVSKVLNKNFYYTVMINGVSNYIFDREETFRKHFRK